MRLAEQAASRSRQLQAIEHTPFAFLTGRPMGQESARDWFVKRFKTEQGELTDAQMMTLYIWTMSEHERAHNRREFTLPVNGTAAQFIKVKEVAKWD